MIYGLMVFLIRSFSFG